MIRKIVTASFCCQLARSSSPSRWPTGSPLRSRSIPSMPRSPLMRRRMPLFVLILMLVIFGVNSRGVVTWFRQRTALGRAEGRRTKPASLRLQLETAGTGSGGRAGGPPCGASARPAE